MFNTDFSRIGEAFYREIGGANEEPTLRGFIRDSFKLYSGRYLKTRKVEGTRKIIYTSDDQTSSLSLHVLSETGYSDLPALEIHADFADLKLLIGNLRGQLTATFSNLNVRDLRAREKIENSRDKNLAQFGALNIYFSRNPNTPGAIQRVAFRGKSLIDRLLERTFDVKKEPITLERMNWGKDEMEILERAGQIEILGSSYEHGDINRDVINERSVIIQPERGRFIWDYKIWTGGNEGLPGYVLPTLERLFGMVEGRFSKAAFRLFRIENPYETQGGLEDE